MKKVCWLLLVGIIVLAVPSQAIFLACEDICSCAFACSKPCRFTPTSPLTNCGAAGEDCIGSPGCSGFAFADPAATTSAQVCQADESEAPVAAPVSAPAPAEPAD
jgi:hypothetical protein